MSASASYTILIVSGGVGASAEQVVHTVLAQFPNQPVQVLTLGNLRQADQVDEAVVRAAHSGSILVHTLVDPNLRSHLVQRAGEMGIPQVDLMGALMEQLQQMMGVQPLGQPGLYRRLNQDYFTRVAAIDFSMAHDDGKNPESWREADLTLVGVSRCGKTPLSMYLAVLGWKVANVPVVPGLELAGELYRLPRERVFGLTIEPGQLLAFRQQRQLRLGTRGPSDYTHPEKIYAELQAARELCLQAGFRLIDVTDKPIESVADEVIRLLARRAARDSL
jgi:[pyruvate, water dikinase]-phosphate phosphotransferase / [pyruvate, water dikinase] kinase